MNPGILTLAQSHSYESEEQPLVAAALLVFQLPIPVTPRFVDVVLICRTADNGYAVGDEIGAETLESTAVNNASIQVIRTNGLVTVKTGTTFITMEKGTTVVYSTITVSRWTVKVYAQWPPLT